MTRTCTLLLSRQALRPCASTPWVAAVKRAVAWAAAEGLTVVSSTGILTWDLVTVAASRAGARLQVLLLASSARSFEESAAAALHDYGVDPGRTTLEPVPGSGAERSAAMRTRDAAVLAAADVLVSVSIRPGGTMAQSLISASAPVVRDFEAPYARRAAALKYELGGTAAPAHSSGAGMITHWTRTSNGPWPTERTRDFCDAVLDSTEYPRSALATLRNILATGHIAASPRHMPGNAPCVSFTAKPPHEFLGHMRWRARYREMSFEPYGLGVAIDVARELGLQPVDYASRDGTPEWLRQTPGSIGDWRSEDEWRHPGDVDLTRVPREQVMCWCWREEEAAAITRESGVRAAGLGHG